MNTADWRHITDVIVMFYGLASFCLLYRSYLWITFTLVTYIILSTLKCTNFILYLHSFGDTIDTGLLDNLMSRYVENQCLYSLFKHGHRMLRFLSSYRMYDHYYLSDWLLRKVLISSHHLNVHIYKMKAPGTMLAGSYFIGAVQCVDVCSCSAGCLRALKFIIMKYIIMEWQWTTFIKK